MRNTRSAIEQILERCAAQAFEDVQRLGHNLKGSGGGYGFPEITSFGQKIEAAAKARDQAALKQHAAALGQYLDRVVIRFV
ncbi:MAG: Hpt domain-containing protein [Leptospirales bacterium]|nr:Hpt domain-containing protein [Leptospirales bacterium]